METPKGKVVIEKASIDDLKELIPVYKEVFEVHHIFDQSEDEVLDYLEKNKSNFLIAKVDGKIVGGLMVTLSRDWGSHGLWRIKHVAVAKGFRDMDIGSSLMEAAEKQIGESKFKTNKIEIHVGQHEEAALPFYKKIGYAVEGELASHYRHGEKVFFLGKEI